MRDPKCSSYSAPKDVPGVRVRNEPQFIPPCPSQVEASNELGTLTGSHVDCLPGPHFEVVVFLEESVELVGDELLPLGKDDVSEHRIGRGENATVKARIAIKSAQTLMNPSESLTSTNSGVKPNVLD